MENTSLSILGKSDKAYQAEIGEFIRNERINQNKTQAEIALHAGISRKSISQLESGKGSISLLMFIQILRSLKLLDRLSVFKPTRVVSPILMAKSFPKERFRVRKGTKAAPIKTKPKSDW